MGDKHIPDYLYHYTSLSSLGLILKNKTLRFNSLKNMDDLEEFKANDLKEYGKYCFISSWTDIAEEKLSLWSMYTGNMTGVRIKLHKLPFETYTYRIKNNQIDIEMKDGFLPQHFFDFENPIPSVFKTEGFILRVEYTEDESLIYPNLLEYNSATNETKLKLPLLGKYKRKEWYFQDEVRYKITYFPFTIHDKDNMDIIKQNIVRQKSLPFKDRYLNIKHEFLNEIEIIKGPKMSFGDSEILDLLVEKYCPTARIIESKFKDKIR